MREKAAKKKNNDFLKEKVKENATKKDDFLWKKIRQKAAKNDVFEDKIKKNNFLSIFEKKKQQQ